MLPRKHRMRDAAEFTAAVRGRRAARATLVVHLAAGAWEGEDATEHRAGERRASRRTGRAAPDRRPARVGFVVSRAVGGAVLRNRVRRRLRHLVGARTGVLPAGSLVVVRALPPAAEASVSTLARDLENALMRLLGARSAIGTGAREESGR